jgi:hypothetical protein
MDYFFTGFFAGFIRGFQAAAGCSIWPIQARWRPGMGRRKE